MGAKLNIKLTNVELTIFNYFCPMEWQLHIAQNAIFEQINKYFNPRVIVHCGFLKKILDEEREREKPCLVAPTCILTEDQTQNLGYVP